MEKVVLEAKNVNFYYGKKKALDSVSCCFYEKRVTAMIGPSGCGKSTFLRCFNRMNDFIEDSRFEGEFLFENKNIYGRKVDPVEIRAHIGMVFQKPNPFPKSIYDNIIWGPKMTGMKFDRDELVESTLKKSALWDEVKDRLNDSAFALSGGQQQRLCIARTIAMSPKVILMDEPCSALDPKSTKVIEDLIRELSSSYSIIIVTHNMQQASRVSDFTSFFYNGKLIEYGPTEQLFTKPEQKQTEDYLTGRFG